MFNEAVENAPELITRTHACIAAKRFRAMLPGMMLTLGSSDPRVRGAVGDAHPPEGSRARHGVYQVAVSGLDVDQIAQRVGHRLPFCPDGCNGPG